MPTLGQRSFNRGVRWGYEGHGRRALVTARHFKSCCRVPRSMFFFAPRFLRGDSKLGGALRGRYVEL